MDGGRRDARRDLIATLGIVALFAALVAGRPLARRFARHPTAERCAAMLERYAAQQARAYERAASTTPRPVGATDVVRCTRDLTDAEVECALKSGYADELERCLPP